MKTQAKTQATITGMADLPLHYGKMPRWLYAKMVELASCIANIIINEYGKHHMLERLADPFWFQAFGCVLGFDWHSSGLTTTVTAALREALVKLDAGIMIAGGKGKTSKKTPEHIQSIAQHFKFDETITQKLINASKLIAKTDNAMLQDGFDLYHHIIAISENKEYAIIQQGMNSSSLYARRYHWLSSEVKQQGLFSDTHKIASDVKQAAVLDLSASKSSKARKAILDIAKQKPSITLKEVSMLKSKIKAIQNRKEKQVTLYAYIPIKILELPYSIDWKSININTKVLEQIYETQPETIEQALMFKGFGKSTIRALALTAALIYGNEVSWQDPCKYAFAHGGKDGVPYPINKKQYEKTIAVLQDAIQQAELKRKDKLLALKRLAKFVR